MGNTCVACIFAFAGTSIEESIFLKRLSIKLTKPSKDFGATISNAPMKTKIPNISLSQTLCPFECWSSDKELEAEDKVIGEGVEGSPAVSRWVSSLAEGAVKCP